VATLHVRNVPPDLYGALRAQARRNGRSITAEVIEMLRRGVRTRTPEELIETIRKGHERVAPILHTLPDPVDVIGNDRDTEHDRIA
jgi:plasmid stability protein